MKRLLKNSVYFILIVMIVAVASRLYEGGPSSASDSLKIIGDTKVEKIESLVSIINKQYGAISEELFAKVHFGGYDPDKKVWRFSMIITKTTDDIASASQGPRSGQDAASLEYRPRFDEIVERLFIEGSKIITPESKNLSLIITFLDSFRVLYSTTQADAIVTIKEQGGWTFFVDAVTDPVKIGESLGELEKGALQQ